MRRFTSTFLALSMMVTVSASGFTTPALRRPQSSDLPTPNAPLINHLLPPGAGSRLTLEMQENWENLSQGQRDEILTLFVNLVKPAILKAIWEAEGSQTDPSYPNSLSFDPTISPPSPANQPPSVSMTASPTTGPAPLTVQFAAYATDPDGQVVSYSWNFGDGQTSSQTTPTHTYQTSGNYTVTLTATDDMGATASYSAIITVLSGSNQPPQINPTASPTTGPAPLTVSFDADASDPDGQIASYSWNFGDGQTSTQAAPTHTYQNPGAYTVNLTVTDNAGAAVHATMIIAVSGGGGGNQPPQVSITASPLSGQVPLTVSFNADASDPDGQIASYSWNFGDGQTSSQMSVSHTYQAAGVYTASVTVTDNVGATASASIGINVMAQPPPPPPVDADGDGLPDTFETQLADAFTPFYFVSTGELPGTGLSTFQDREDAQLVMQVFSPPTVISYYRVLPRETKDGKRYIQIDYLTLWNRDDGLQIDGICENILGLFGFEGIFQFLGFPHDLDNERSISVVSTPAVGSGFNLDPNAYQLERFFTAAHEGESIFDNSFTVTLSPPIIAPAHPHLFFSRSKHATYPFNPEGIILLPLSIILSIYTALAYACINVPLEWCIFLQFLADLLVLTCFVERFGDQGGVTAQTRINVGEVMQPINGSRFIRTPALTGKLARRPSLP